jgi:hypothetical protein
VNERSCLLAFSANHYLKESQVELLSVKLEDQIPVVGESSEGFKMVPLLGWDLSIAEGIIFSVT